MKEGGAAEMVRYARVAGVGYLLIIASGIWAEFVVRGGLVVPGDPAATVANIRASEILFRGSLAAEFVMLTADVVVAVALWVVFRPVSRGLALLAASFRLVHAAVVGANMMNVWIPLLLVTGAGGTGLADEPTREALVAVHLQAHGWGYAAGLVFFAGACTVTGYLVVRSRLAPPALGWMLIVAGLAYLVDGLARTLMPNYADYETALGLAVLLPAFVAELSFTVWLLARGVDRERAAALEEVA